MKCKNCSCQVSSEFNHAFTKNICPKCGQQMMDQDVKTLFLKMDEVLKQDNNDVGDLAVWFIKEYFSNSETKTEENSIESSASSQNEEVFDVQGTPEDEVPVLKPTKPLPKPKKILPPTGPQERKLLSNDQVSSFAKRAGIKPQEQDKFKSLVRDIQNLDGGDSMPDFGGAQDYQMGPEDGNPLDYNELSNLENVFEDNTSQAMDLREIQRIQRLDQMSMSGSVGVIKRAT